MHHEAGPLARAGTGVPLDDGGVAGKALARSLFNGYAERYHPIARAAVESILNRA